MSLRGSDCARLLIRATKRLGDGKAASSNAAKWAPHRFGDSRHPSRSNFVARWPKEADNHAYGPWDPGNVGEYGARIEPPADGGRTALMIAAMFDRSEIVELLLSQGADPNAKDGTGLTALDMANAMDATNTQNVLQNVRSDAGRRLPRKRINSNRPER
jgi:ankyrin repeat protein